MNIQLLKPHAKIPTKGSSSAAGYDLCTCEHAIIPSGCRAKLSTGIALELEEGTVGLIWPRSKLASLYGIAVLGGVIDSDYRGEIMISILNTGDRPLEIFKDDKIAQLLIQPIMNQYEFNIVDSLDDTTRGKRGINDSELRIR